MFRPTRQCLFVALLLGVGVPVHEAHAQMQWSRVSAAGYATVGVGVGLIFSSGMSYELGGSRTHLYVPPVLGLVAGAFVGHVIGENAERELAGGRELSGAHKNAVRLGTVLMGVTTGVIVAGLLINPDGTSSGMSDESIFASLSLGGAVLGTLLQASLEPQLRPAGSVEGGLGYAPGGGVTLGVRYTF